MRTLRCILCAIVSRFSLRFPDSQSTCLALLGIFALLPLPSPAQDIVISEVMAENRHGLIDGSGLRQDWLELENRSGTDLNLTGWHLTDDPRQLDKWTFPPRTLRAKERLVVFASGRNQTDAAGHLHTNFRLSSSGEYLALTRPDRSIASEFSPSFPEQLPDVAFGLGPTVSTRTVVSAGSSALALVHAQGVLPPDWTQPNYDASAWNANLARAGSGQIVISELALDSPRFVEIQNVSAASVNLEGWRLIINESATGDIDEVSTSRWILSGVLAPGGTDYRGDFPVPRAWGAPLGWSSEGPGWVMLLGPEHQVVDFVSWGYSTAQLQAFGILIEGQPIGGGRLVDSFDYRDSAGLTSVWTGPVLGGLRATNITFGITEGELQIRDIRDASASSGTAMTVFTRMLPTPLTGDFRATLSFSWDCPDPGFLGGLFLEAWRTGGILASGGWQDDNAAGPAGFGFRYGQIGGRSTFVSATGSSDPNLSPETMTGAQASSHRGNTLASSGALSILTASATPAKGSAILELSRRGRISRVRWMEPDRVWDLVELQNSNTNPLTSLRIAANHWRYQGAPFPVLSIDEVIVESDARGASVPWKGPSLAHSLANSGLSWQRVGDRDQDGAEDFVAQVRSPGSLNQNLQSKFAVPPVRLPLGYDRSLGGAPAPGTDVEPALWNRNASLLVRIPFEVTEDGMLASLLKVTHDAGFVAYINGREMARQNAPDLLNWNSTASGPAEMSRGLLSFESDLFGQQLALPKGTNVLAIHVLNETARDSTLWISAELEVARPTGGASALRYLPYPTPGSPNSVGSPGVSAEPSTSIPSGAYQDPLSVALSIPADGEIRYTLDGSAPTPRSALYRQPLLITDTTLLRARTFTPGLLPSRGIERTYVFVDSSMDSRESNVPLLLLSTGGRQIAGTADAQLTRIHAVGIDVQGTNRATWRSSPDFIGRAGLRVRGSSSANWPKQSYAFETQNADGEDESVALFGLPADSDWVLHASYLDRTLLRDSLAYELSRQIGRYAARTRPVEVYLNTNGRKVSAADYLGVYLLVERIKRSEERIPLQELGPLDNQEPEVTGGYLVKKDRLDPGDNGFLTLRADRLGFVDPEESALSGAQRAWISNYFRQFETVLYSAAYTNAETGYAQFIDVDAWIDHHLLIEMTFNIDGFYLSTHLQKERGGKLVIGPVWDFDRSMGNTTQIGADKPTGWYVDALNGFFGVGSTFYPWWPRLFQDPAFKQRSIDRWQQLRHGPFADTNIIAWIDRLAQERLEAQERNFAKWPVLAQPLDVSPLGFPTYAQHVAHLKSWMAARLAWIDSQFLPLPRFGAARPDPEGRITVRLDVPNLPSLDSSLQLYYTTNGLDPRSPAGGIEVSAVAAPAPPSTPVVLPEAPLRFLIPTTTNGGSLLGTNWVWPGFDDQNWTSGTTGAGYDRLGVFTPLIRTDLNAQMFGVNRSAFLRIPFSVPSPIPAGQLFLRMKYDDGYVAFLNGGRVSLRSAPATVNWNSGASANRPKSAATVYEDTNLGSAESWLRPGENLLAVQGLNDAATSTEFLILPELGIAAGPQSVITFEGPTRLMARTYQSGRWSGLAEIALGFAVPRLRITEVMYHPANPPSGSPYLEEDFEFIEIQNATEVCLPLRDVRVTGGIDFTFSSRETYLAPGEYVVLAKNRTAFVSRYGDLKLRMASGFEGKLSNGSDSLTLQDSTGIVRHSFTYDDAWQPTTDGGGYSLTLQDPFADRVEWSDPKYWKASSSRGGSPGRDDSGILPTWDADRDTLPDRWEQDFLGGSVAEEDDSDGDGFSNLHEYIVGTDPADPGERFRITVEADQGIVWVHIPTRLASSRYHPGLVRFYALEERQDLEESQSSWMISSQMAKQPATGGILQLQIPGGLASSRFFRARVWLDCPNP
ncbi:MAG: CotH kinase family protein [Verrucomicrobiales bacterium]|nr:CotH kinase family protein [Verrucomicrobiales bacterium]